VVSSSVSPPRTQMARRLVSATPWPQCLFSNSSSRDVSPQVACPGDWMISGARQARKDEKQNRAAIVRRKNILG